MPATSFIDLNVNNAEQFRESVSESQNTVIYLTFGKVDAWANEANPDIANSSMSTVFDVWNNMIGGKRLVGSDISHVIPRNTWAANTVYDAYNHTRSDLFDSNTKMCVVNSTYDVYKCIANNYGANSTVEPTSTNPSIISVTSDGYYWKYMYTISDADQLRFMTSSYIPVKTLSINDGSTQWSVQNNAIDGAIHYIDITNQGSGYTNANSITVTITGDGSDARAIASINSTSNSINSITIIDSGTGYSYATVSISAGANSNNATAVAIISPPGGHGSNPVYELGGKYLMINGRLKYDENTVFPTTNDFRQIALVKDPYARGTSNVASNSAIRQAVTITTVGVGDYTQDEWVYQGSSLIASTYKGRVVSWDSTTGKILLINTVGSLTAAQPLIGTTSFVSRVVTSVTEETLKKYSGKILYVDNIEAVTRDPDQIEDFKILVKY